MLLIVAGKVADSFFELLFDLFFSVVLLALNVAEHDALFVHYLHVVVSRVSVMGYRQIDLLEVLDRFGSLSIENDVTIDHQNHVVELHKDFGGRLMDG